MGTIKKRNLKKKERPFKVEHKHLDQAYKRPTVLEVHFIEEGTRT